MNNTTQGERLTIQRLSRQLPQYEEQEARSIVRLLLFDVFHLTLTDICCGALERLSAEEMQVLKEKMSELAAGIPVQYVTGVSTFRSRTFHVRSGVLIPRPETEQLCDIIDEWIRSQKAGKDSTRMNNAGKYNAETSILDIGTGSGCIAVSLSCENDSAFVTAWDISDEALNIAKENATLNNAKITFEHQDALTPPADVEKWDVVVSNPPYICHMESSDMEPHVLDYEPHTALFVPDNAPLLFYHAITGYARKALKPGGLLAFEINPLYAEMLREELTREDRQDTEGGPHTFCDVTIHQDIFGKSRFITAIRK